MQCVYTRICADGVYILVYTTIRASLCVQTHSIIYSYIQSWMVVDLSHPLIGRTVVRCCDGWTNMLTKTTTATAVAILSSSSSYFSIECRALRRYGSDVCLLLVQRPFAPKCSNVIRASDATSVRLE